MSKFYNTIFFLFLIAIIFLFRERIQIVWTDSYYRYFPCKTAMSYSIGGFDKRFGLSQSDFLSAIKEAEDIWEKPLGKDLFSYSPKGNLKINLIYDERQASTVQLQNVQSDLKGDKESYNRLKQNYDSLVSEYNIQKSAFDAKVSAFDTRKSQYEAEVDVVNRKGGANKATYNRLSTEKQYLSDESASIIQAQNSLNNKIREINVAADSMNQVAKTLNMKVTTFNTIGSSLGGEFNEGLFKSSVDGREIDIYQFDNKTKLIRLLAHEFGHALGLDHNEDPKAIMYRLNNGINEKLTNTDMVEVKTLCGVK